MVDRDGQPPAERPTLQERVRKPRSPEARGSRDCSQVDVPDVPRIPGRYDPRGRIGGVYDGWWDIRAGGRRRINSQQPTRNAQASSPLASSSQDFQVNGGRPVISNQLSVIRRKAGSAPNGRCLKRVIRTRRGFQSPFDFAQGSGDITTRIPRAHLRNRRWATISHPSTELGAPRRRRKADHWSLLVFR